MSLLICGLKSLPSSSSPSISFLGLFSPGSSLDIPAFSCLHTFSWEASAFLATTVETV